MRILNSELEIRVAERTQELEETHRIQDALLDSERAARARADERNATLERPQDTLREYIDTVSHDLRTPLTSIIGEAYMLAKHPDRPEDITRSSGRIDASARRMNAMIHELVETAGGSQATGSRSLVPP